MPFQLTRRHYKIVAIGVALALLAVMGLRLAQAHGLLLADGNPVFGDFIAFWSAGRLALDGRAELVHAWSAIQAVESEAVPGLRLFAPWNSPPHFLLIAAALALFPFPVAALIWLACGATLYFIAARKVLPDGRALAFALTLPAALYHLGSVQTGLCIAGASGLALYWLDARPLRAGALIGLLAIKPHLAILWPVYLALTGRWRAFAAAALSLALFTLAAMLAFGWDSIPRFLENLAVSQHFIDSERVPNATFASLYGNLVALGVDNAPSMLIHVLSAAAALGAAILVFRGRDVRAQGAALCAATMLVSPYLFFYDATLLALGAAVLGAPRDRFAAIALVFAWGAGLSLAVGQVIALPICPLAAWLVLTNAVARMRAAPRPMKTVRAPAKSARSSRPGAA